VFIVLKGCALGIAAPEWSGLFCGFKERFPGMFPSTPEVSGQGDSPTTKNNHKKDTAESPTPRLCSDFVPKFREKKHKSGGNAQKMNFNRQKW